MEKAQVKLSNLRRNTILESVTHFVLILYLPSDFCSIKGFCRVIFPSLRGKGDNE